MQKLGIPKQTEFPIVSDPVPKNCMRRRPHIQFLHRWGGIKFKTNEHKDMEDMAKEKRNNSQGK